MTCVDLESKDALKSFQAYEHLIKQLPSEITVKFKLIDSWTHHFDSSRDGVRPSRSETFRSVGHRLKRLILCFEWDKNPKLAIEQLPLDALKSIAVPLSEEETKALFQYPQSAITERGSLLDFGDHLKGVYRIYQQGVDAISEGTLPGLLESLVSDYELTVSVKKVSASKIESRLNRKATKAKMGSGVLASDKIYAAEEAIRAVSLFGESFYEVEWVIILSARSEGELRDALSQAKGALLSFGTGCIEGPGAFHSYSRSRPGSGRQHVTFTEQSPTVQYYLPICAFGEQGAAAEARATTLLLHRQDGSAHAFDQFNPNFSSYNMIVSGKTGSGKSVFGNANSQALLNDPNLHMIKVDVGGSYRRECEQYGGLEVCFNLNEPSGIDPFCFIQDEISINDSVSVLTEFLCTLALEEGESSITREMKGDFELAVKNYVTGHNQFSYQDFISKNQDIPRYKLLRRWDSGGQYENALKSRDGFDFKNRYIYFNFESILNAANPDYVAGVMAAVIAKVNIDLIYLSLPKNRRLGKRLIFFCDETKFFLEKNGTFFLLTSANFRKFGHANILTGQNINDFILKINGKEDLGLILNSPIRVFYETVADPEFLKRVFGLNEREIEIIRNNPYRGKDFRQFILQDDTGTRLMRLFLTKKEYLGMTSSRSEVDKINSIREQFPSLTQDEVIGLIQMGGLI
jgi:hypothetical protein